MIDFRERRFYAVDVGEADDVIEGRSVHYLTEGQRLENPDLLEALVDMGFENLGFAENGRTLVLGEPAQTTLDQTAPDSVPIVEAVRQQLVSDDAFHAAVAAKVAEVIAAAAPPVVITTEPVVEAAPVAVDPAPADAPVADTAAVADAPVQP